MPETPATTTADRVCAVRARFPVSRIAYVRGQVARAVRATNFAAAGLLAPGSPHFRLGPVGALLAIGGRGIHLASDEVSQSRNLAASRLIASRGRTVALREIDPVRRLESAVQIVSRSGDMPRLKLLSGPRAARESIAQATKGGEA